MNVGGTTSVKDATIHLVEAVHSGGFGQDKAGPKYSGPAMGFVIEIAKGPTLYHAGDTDVFSGMSLIADRYHPTIAMLPIGGHFTMDPTGAALAAKLLKVKTVIPMHYGTFPALAGTPDQLRDALKKAKSSAKVARGQARRTAAAEVEPEAPASGASPFTGSPTEGEPACGHHGLVRLARHLIHRDYSNLTKLGQEVFVRRRRPCPGRSTAVPFPTS